MMKKCLFILASMMFTGITMAETAPDSLYSNVTIQNKTGAPVTAYGLYVNTLSSVDTTASSCTSPSQVYTSGQTSGAYVSPVAFQSNQTVQLSQNYLYNMIFSAIFYANSASSSPCTLPGCSWFSDSTPKNWCVYLGVLGPGSGNSTSSNVPPFGVDTNGAGYRYDLVTSYHYIGPIQCNDLTMTCAVSNVQNQAFP